MKKINIGSTCRFCNEPLQDTFVDLGVTPLCQTHISPDQLSEMEPFYPLNALVCRSCFLVQLDHRVSSDQIFSEYAYFSSYSESWLRHAERFCAMVSERFQLGPSNFVVELASNDGYLLRNFVRKRIPALGIEPAANVAEKAVAEGVETLVRFFGDSVAKEVRERWQAADLIIGNNVLAHVPDLNDFVAGIRSLLADNGVVTMEFPHLLRLMDEVQFDTIYHEHFSYFSFLAANKVFQQHGLVIFDVDQLSTHGGSLRIYACRESAGREISGSVMSLIEEETEAKMDRMETYLGFQERVDGIKRELLEFLIRQKNDDRRIVGYGAPGKGNTLLNYCGIGTDFLDFTVDRNPYKQGKFTPGSRIPILDPNAIRDAKPDFILILPWNLAAEIVDANSYVSDWGGQFVIPIPEVRIVSADDYVS